MGSFAAYERSSAHGQLPLVEIFTSERLPTPWITWRRSMLMPLAACTFNASPTQLPSSFAGVATTWRRGVHCAWSVSLIFASVSSICCCMPCKLAGAAESDLRETKK